MLIALVDRVTRRMRAAGRVGRTVVLRLRFDDFSRATRSHTLPEATAETQLDPVDRRGLLAVAVPMIERRGPDADRASSVANLDNDDADAADAPARARRATARSTPRSTRCATRFGTAAITRAVLLGRDQGWSVPLLPD